MYFWLGFTEAQGVMCLPTRGLSREPGLELHGCSSPSPPGCRDLGPEPALHGGLHPVAPKCSAPRPNDSWAVLASKFDIYKLFWQAGFLHPASFLLQQLTDLGRSGWVWEALWGMLQLRAPCLRCQERGGPVAAVARL